MAAGGKCEWETEVGPDGRLLTVGELGTDETDEREECEPERLEIIHRVIQQTIPPAVGSNDVVREARTPKILLSTGERRGVGRGRCTERRFSPRLPVRTLVRDIWVVRGSTADADGE